MPFSDRPGLLSMGRCNALKQHSLLVSVLENVINAVTPSSLLLLAETSSPLTLALNFLLGVVFCIDYYWHIWHFCHYFNAFITYAILCTLIVNWVARLTSKSLSYWHCAFTTKDIWLWWLTKFLVGKWAFVYRFMRNVLTYASHFVIRSLFLSSSNHRKIMENRNWEAAMHMLHES